MNISERLAPEPPDDLSSSWMDCANCGDRHENTYRIYRAVRDGERDEDGSLIEPYCAPCVESIVDTMQKWMDAYNTPQEKLPWSAPKHLPKVEVEGFWRRTIKAILS
jgi:hypothetical protein